MSEKIDLLVFDEDELKDHEECIFALMAKVNEIIEKMQQEGKEGE